MADLSNLLLVLICLIAGIALKWRRALPKDAATSLNRFVIYVSLPALTLNQLHGASLGRNVLYPIGMAWVLFIAGSLVLGTLARAAGWSRATLGCLILTAGLGNTSFVGYPLIEAFYGRNDVAIGVLADQGGTFLVLGTLGILIAGICSGATAGPGSATAIGRRIALFPPFWSALLALALRPFHYPEIVTGLLGRLGSTLVPVALVSVGLQLAFDSGNLKAECKTLVAGLSYKLALGPALIALLYFGLLRASGRVVEISVFEAAMGPMITGGIVATEYGLNPRLAALMIGIGMPLSLLTVPLWWWLLQRLGSG